MATVRVALLIVTKNSLENILTSNSMAKSKSEILKMWVWLAKNPAFKDINAASLKAAYSGLVTLAIEAAKCDSNEQNLSTTLEECKYTSDRINDFNKVFLPQKSHIQLLLGKIGSSFPHIVDVDWRLDYYIKNNHLEKIDSPVYLICLHTEMPGEPELKEIQFSCTLEQLQDLVGKLKDATKCMEKIAQV